MNENIYKPPESELNEIESQVYELASRGSRFLASLLDGIIMLLLLVPIILFTGAFDSIYDGVEPSFIYGLTIGVIVIAIFLIINWNFLKTTGQTVGKKVLGIKIVTLDDKLPIMGDHILKRYSFYFLIGYVPVIGQFLSLVNVLFIFSSNRMCLHDRVAGTKVVQL